MKILKVTDKVLTSKRNLGFSSTLTSVVVPGDT